MLMNFFQVNNIKMEHEPDLNQYNSNLITTKCSVCSKTFSTKKNLTNHRMTFHLKQFPFKCMYPNCTKAYSISSRLKVHMHTHTNHKPFQCSKCSKSFLEKGYLKTHLKFHLPQRPFACVICTKTYKTKGHLKDHIQIQHEGMRKYHCTLCTKRFGRSSTLKSHYRTHTGKKNIKCPINFCGHYFFEKGNMEIHYKRHLKRMQIKSMNMPIDIIPPDEKLNSHSIYQNMTSTCSNDTLFNKGIDEINSNICIVKKCKKIKNSNSNNNNFYDKHTLISNFQSDLMQNRIIISSQLDNKSIYETNNRNGSNTGNQGNAINNVNEFHLSESDQDDNDNDGNNSFHFSFL